MRIAIAIALSICGICTAAQYGLRSPAYLANLSARGGAEPIGPSKSNLISYYEFASTNDAHGSNPWSVTNTPLFTNGYVQTFAGSTSLLFQASSALGAAWDTNQTQGATWFVSVMGNSGIASGSVLMDVKNLRTRLRWLLPNMDARIGTTTGASIHAPVTNQWYDIWAVRDGTNRMFYVNGVAYGPDTSAFGVGAASAFLGGASITIGYNASFRAAGFWNRPLATNEFLGLSGDLAYSDLKP